MSEPTATQAVPVIPGPGEGHVPTVPAAPPAAPEATHLGGIFARVKAWLEEHVAPDIAAARADTGKVLGYVAAHAQTVDALASLVVKITQAADPAVAPEVAALAAEAEKVAAAASETAARLAAELEGTSAT